MVPTGGTGEEISYRSLSQPSIHFEKHRRQSIFMKTRIKNLLSENTLAVAGVEWGQAFQLHQILHLTISVSPHRLAGSHTFAIGSTSDSNCGKCCKQCNTLAGKCLNELFWYTDIVFSPIHIEQNIGRKGLARQNKYLSSWQWKNTTGFRRAFGRLSEGFRRAFGRLSEAVRKAARMSNRI